MREIKLTDNSRAFVDDNDFERISQFRWTRHKDGYAYHSFTQKGKTHCLFMHRLILKIPPSIYHIDHKDRNPLNNCKSNLRFCTFSQNMANRKKNMNTSSKYKGVYRKGKRFMAYCRINGKHTYLGYFDTEEAAALIYNQQAIKSYGEFALLNEVAL